MTPSTPEPPRVPNAYDDAYFELVGARIHTSDLADAISPNEPIASADLQRLIDVTARLLGDLDRLWAALPLPEAAAGMRGPLGAATEAFRSAIGGQGDGSGSSERVPLTVEEVEAYREAAAHEWQARYLAGRATDDATKDGGHGDGATDAS